MKQKATSEEAEALKAGGEGSSGGNGGNAKVKAEGTASRCRIWSKAWLQRWQR